MPQSQYVAQAVWASGPGSEPSQSHDDPCCSCSSATTYPPPLFVSLASVSCSPMCASHLLFQSCSLNEASSNLFDVFLRLVYNHIIRIGGK